MRQSERKRVWNESSHESCAGEIVPSQNHGTIFTAPMTVYTLLQQILFARIDRLRALSSFRFNASPRSLPVHLTLLGLYLLQSGSIRIEQRKAAENTIAELEGLLCGGLEGPFEPDRIATAPAHEARQLEEHRVESIAGGSLIDNLLVLAHSAHVVLPLFQVRL